MSTVVKNLLEIAVDDHLHHAYVRPVGNVTPQSITARVLADELQAAHVAIDEQVKQRMKEFLDRLTSGGGTKDRFLIAECQLPVESEPGDFQWAGGESATAGSSSGDEVEELIRNARCVVARDEVVGKIVPPKDGVHGKNVYGETMYPKVAKGQPVQLDDSVRLADDGITVLANRPGRVVFEAGLVAVHEVTRLQRDIKPGVEKLDWDTDVIIEGVVNDSADLASDQTIVVSEAIQAASVRCGKDLLVRYGIIGQGKGRISVGRDVVAGFYEDVETRAGRDVLIGASAVNSRIRAGGRVLAANARIIGGEIHAGRCLNAHVIGSEAGITTKVYIAVPGQASSEPNEQDGPTAERRSRLREIQARLCTLRKNAKSLTPAQRKEATELGFEAQALRNEIAGPQGDDVSSPPAEQRNGHLRVLSKVHEGLHLTITNRKAVIDKELQGPLRIELRKVRGATELVAVAEDDGLLRVLESHRIDED